MKRSVLNDGPTSDGRHRGVTFQTPLRFLRRRLFHHPLLQLASVPAEVVVRAYCFKRRKGQVQMEPTKSWWYVGLDLGIKLISALSFVFLGYVGWRLQKTNADNAERRKDAELQAANELRQRQDDD